MVVTLCSCTTINSDDTLKNNENSTNSQSDPNENNDPPVTPNFEKIVYTNFTVSGLNSDVKVENIPDNFALLESDSLLESYRVKDEVCKKFNLGGEAFDIVKKMSYEKKYSDSIGIDSHYADRSFYSSDKFDVILGDATDILYMFYMNQTILEDANDAKLEENDITKIVNDFKTEHSLGDLTDAFVKTYLKNDNGHEVKYVLNIG